MYSLLLLESRLCLVAEGYPISPLRNTFISQDGMSSCLSTIESLQRSEGLGIKQLDDV